MGRAKLSMELIKNEKARHLTFQKRKNGLKKKTHELSTLCGVKVCIIVYGPKHNDQPIDPEIWPTNRGEILDLIRKYKEQSEDDRAKRTLDVSNIFEDQKKKTENALVKLRRKNDEAKYPTWDDQYNNLFEEQLRGFYSFLESKLEAAKNRFAFLKGNQNHSCFKQTLYRRSSMELEVFHPHPHPHPISTINPYEPFDQTQQGPTNFDSNSMMMMLMNNNDCAQFGGASSSNVMYAPLNGLVYYDPMSGMAETMMVNNPSLQPPMCYYNPTVQQLPQYLQYPIMTGTSSNVHASQMDEYYNVIDFQVDRK